MGTSEKPAGEPEARLGGLNIELPGILGAAAIVVAALIGFGWQTCMYHGCPDVSSLRGWVPDQATVVLDRDGREIGRLFETRRTVVSMDSLPPWVAGAFVAMEDRRFYRHHGVDWVRFAGAMRSNLKAMGVREGGSTITMQLARNVFPEFLPPRERTILRKLKEMRVAQLLESELDKHTILNLYLNEIYLGEGAYGVDAAAREYFGHPAAQLTLAESAMLASLPRAPERYNPRDNENAALRGRSTVLRRMAETGVVNEEAADAAADAALVLADLPETRGFAAWFIEEVRQEMQARFGEDLYTAGYRIHTTLDRGTQVALEEELESQAEAIEAGKLGRFAADGETLQYAGVVLDARSGDVLGLVGGRDFTQSRFDRATQAMRQPGSAFKPVVYAAAIEAGHSPVERLSDEPVSITDDEGDTWSPHNYGGAAGSYELVSMRDALKRSRNIATVRLAQDIGVTRVARLAERMGLARDVPAYASLPLGTVETTPMALTAAYAALATDGQRPEPRLVVRVEDRHGNTVWRSDVVRHPVMNETTAFLTTDLLRSVVDGGTGWRVRQAGFRGPAAGKTGTTQDAADLWFTGFTPDRVATIWYGFDRRRPVMRGGTGGDIAAPVWGRVMKRSGPEDTEPWEPPNGVEQVRVDALGTVLASGCAGVGPVEYGYVRTGPYGPDTSCPPPVLPTIMQVGTGKTGRPMIRLVGASGGNER